MSTTRFAPQRTELWRVTVAGIAWVLIALSVGALFFLVVQLFGLALGQALHAHVTASDFMPVFRWFVGMAIVLGIVAIAAGLARRWVAMVFAVLIVAVSALFAIGLLPNVQGETAPIEQVDENPLTCQCYSGGDCDCPGG